MQASRRVGGIHSSLAKYIWLLQCEICSPPLRTIRVRGIRSGLFGSYVRAEDNIGSSPGLVVPPNLDPSYIMECSGNLWAQFEPGWIRSRWLSTRWCGSKCILHVRVIIRQRPSRERTLHDSMVSMLSNEDDALTTFFAYGRKPATIGKL